MSIFQKQMKAHGKAHPEVVLHQTEKNIEPRKYFQKLSPEDIAALAPEMYEALKGVEDWMQECGMDEDDYPRLAKACCLAAKIDGRIVE